MLICCFVKELRDQLTDYQGRVESLVEKSKSIVPLMARRQRVDIPVPVKALCAYKQLNVSMQSSTETIYTRGCITGISLQK